MRTVGKQPFSSPLGQKRPGEEAIIEQWLLEEVLPTVDEMHTHPERLIPVDEAFDRIETKLRALVRR